MGITGIVTFIMAGCGAVSHLPSGDPGSLLPPRGTFGVQLTGRPLFIPDNDCQDGLFGECPGLADELDSRISALAVRLVSDGAALTEQNPTVLRLRGVLGSIAGRIVVGRHVDRLVTLRRARAVAAAFEEFVAVHFRRVGDKYELRDDQASFHQWFVAASRQYQDDMRAVLPHIEALANNLPDEPEISRSLRSFLQLNAGPHIAYTTLIRPRLRPDPIRRALSKMFVIDDGAALGGGAALGDIGRYRIPKVHRELARRYLQRSQTQLAAIDRFVKKTSQLAREIMALDELHKRYKQAMVDPVFLGLLSRATRAQYPGLSGEALADRIFTELTVAFPVTPSGRRLRDEHAPQVAKALQDYELAKVALVPFRASARRFVSRIALDTEFRGVWADLLNSEVGLLEVARAEAEAKIDPMAVLQANTILGTGIVQNDDGTYQVIRHSATALFVGLRSMTEALRGLEALFDLIDAFAATLQDQRLRNLYKSFSGKFAVTEALRSALADVHIAGRSTDGLTDWFAQYFETTPQGHVPRDGARMELDSFFDEVSVVEREMALAGGPLRIDLSRLPFSMDHAHLFRSSTFYNARTAGGALTYRTDFDDHEVAHLFHVFEWDVHQSTDLTSFREYLWGRRSWVADLAKTHDTFVVTLVKMPEWLSVSSDRTFFEPTWMNLHAHSPRDYEMWRQLVRETVAFFKQFHNVNMYYEVWNEPDGGYWQEDLDSYLKLYEETARTVKEADPQAKVGGAAVNNWDGKLRQAPDRGPVNLELIRFARDKGLPLDFISWHQFSGQPQTLLEAKAAYETAIRESRYITSPAFHVSEWNNVAHLRDTVYSAVGLAEHFLALYEAGVDLQTVAAWEDFSPRPDPNGFAPYGLISQQGRKKPEFFAHRFFDRLSRETEGISVLNLDGGRTKVVVSRKQGGCYDILLWQLGLDSSGGTHLFRLELTGDTDIKRVFGQSVRTSLGQKRVYTAGNRLACELEKYELLRLRVCME